MFLENLSLSKRCCYFSHIQKWVFHSNCHGSLLLFLLDSNSHTPSQGYNLNLSHTAVVPTVHIPSNRYTERWRLKSTNTDTDTHIHTHAHLLTHIDRPTKTDNGLYIALYILLVLLFIILLFQFTTLLYHSEIILSTHLLVHAHYVPHGQGLVRQAYCCSFISQQGTWHLAGIQ